MASIKPSKLMIVVSDHHKMAQKAWEFFLRFQHLICVFLVALILVVVNLTQEISYWNIGKIQFKTKKEQIIAQNKSSNPSCDYFTGRWIYDNVSYPLYEETKCSFMDDCFACETYGRKDLKYRNWRWQPQNCDIPRFNGRAFMEKIRGKKLVFVGDSLNRNQWYSLLCMIEPSLSPSTQKFIFKDGNLAFIHDPGYNSTIGFYWSPFLVESNSDDPREHRNKERIIRFKSIENHARHWNDADILIFDSFSWWMNPKITILWGSFGSPDAVYKTIEMKQRRYEIMLNTWSNWLEMNINRTKTRLFFMGFSPNVFRSDPLRHCYNKSEPTRVEYNWGSSTRDMMNIVDSTLQMLEMRGVKVHHLRITRLSEYRLDAHPSIYRKWFVPWTQENKKDPSSIADCLHWCIPGVPDTWNEILSAYIMN